MTLCELQAKILEETYRIETVDLFVPEVNLPRKVNRWLEGEREA